MDLTKILPRFKMPVNPVFQSALEGLGEKQKSVLKSLKSISSGATARELTIHMKNQGLIFSTERNEVHPRLTELETKGLVKIVGKKTCQYTNRRVSIYKSKI